MRAWTREGTALIAAGCVPFAVGALASRDGVDWMPPCPFRSLTGLPCPLCGATRAFALAARGDSGFASYNAVWVVVAALLIVAGALALVTRRRPVLATTATTAVAVLVAAVAWGYALAQRATIVG